MKLPLTAVAICVFIFIGIFKATVGKAETYELEQHSDWRVLLSEQNDVMACGANVFDKSYAALAIIMVENGDTFLRVHTPGTDDSTVYTDMHIVSGQEYWTFSNTIWAGQMLEYNLSYENVEDVAEFLWMLAEGITAKVVVQNTEIASFSLRGSKRAIDGLFECYERIQPSF